MSAVSWPLWRSVSSRASTCPGEGRNSGRMRPPAVTAYQATPSAAKTRAATARNSVPEMRPPRAKSRRALPGLLGRGIHEPAVDGARQIDILLENAGVLRGGLDFRDHLLGEIAGEFGLVLFDRIVDD